MTETSETSDVAVTLDERVLTIRLDRVKKKNALTLAMYDAMNAALQRAVDDPQIRVVVLRGADGCFTAGNDLADFMQRPPTSADSPVGRFLGLLGSFPKPLVAAVSGVAIGVGTTLLLHCDLVYAASDARLQLPFVPLGLSPEAGSSVLLPQLVGHARASELLLFGEPFDAATALALGLVNRVLEPAQLYDYVQSRAHALAALPPASIRLTKRLLREGGRETLTACMAAEAEAFFERLRSPEAAEAMSAFFGKRKPDFSRFD